MNRRGALAALGAACAAPRAAVAQSTTATTLRVATTPIELGAEVFYAQDQGFFDRAGLRVEVQVMESGAAIAAAVAAGSLDVAQANLVSLATAHARGLPFVAVAPAGRYEAADPTTALVVAKQSRIASARDCTNATIAVNGLRNITQIGASAWLDRSGGSAAGVHFIEMPFAQMAPSLAAGRIDAAMIAEPELSAALADGARAIAQPYTAIAPRFLIGAWFTTAPWAKEHADAVRRFAGAIVAAGAWANGHRAASATILEKYTKIRVAPSMHRTTYAERLDAAEVQPLIDAAARYGALPASFAAAALFAHP